MVGKLQLAGKANNSDPEIADKIDYSLSGSPVRVTDIEHITIS